MSADNRARRFAVISGKGGVGKTIMAANLAAALSSMGVRTLVVDADLGLANIDIILGLNPERALPDLLRGDCCLSEVLVTAPGGFDLLPAGSGLLDGTRLTPTLSERLDLLMRELDQSYDAILFDAGAGIGDLVILFACMAHGLILVTTPEPTSLTDAYATMKVLARRFGRREFFLVVNAVDPTRAEEIGTAVAGRLQEVTSRFLGGENEGPVLVRLAASIPRDPVVPEAVSRQRLISDIRPDSPAACAIASLAAGIWSAPVTAPEVHVSR